MLHDSSAFETWAHSILSVARVTEEDQEGHVNQESNGIWKDAAAGVWDGLQLNVSASKKHNMLVDIIRCL